MVGLDLAMRRFLRGSRRTAIFAVTSKCNCRCEMCDVYVNKPVDISYRNAAKVLDFMADNQFLITYFTGGEPSLHPDIVKIVEYACRLGLFTSLTTNGTIKPAILRELKEAGLHTLSVSIDSWNPQTCEKIRGFKEIQRRAKETVRLAKELDIAVYSLTYLGSHITPANIEKMVSYVNRTLGIPFALCYPTATSSNTYLLGQKVPEQSFLNIKTSAQKLLELKKKGYKIANMATYLEEVIHFHEGRPSKYPCRCGEYVFYIDWFGDVYPCFMKKKLFNIVKENVSNAASLFPENERCNKCLIDCFREPSYLAYLKSPTLIQKELRNRFPLKSLL